MRAISLANIYHLKERDNDREIYREHLIIHLAISILYIMLQNYADSNRIQSRISFSEQM